MGWNIGIFLFIYIFNSYLEFYCYRIIINPFLFKYLLSIYFLHFYLIFIIKINASSSNDIVRRLECWSNYIISAKIYFITQSNTGDKKRHFKTIKVWIQQENIKILNILNKGTKYMRQKLTDLKGKIGNLTIRVGDFSTFLWTVNRISREETGYRILE